MRGKWSNEAGTIAINTYSLHQDGRYVDIDMSGSSPLPISQSAILLFSRSSDPFFSVFLALLSCDRCSILIASDNDIL